MRRKVEKIISNPIRLLLYIYNIPLRSLVTILDEKEGYIYSSIRNYDFYQRPYSYIDKFAKFLNTSQDFFVKRDTKKCIKISILNKIYYLDFKDYIIARGKGVIEEKLDEVNKTIIRKIKDINLIEEVISIDKDKVNLSKVLENYNYVDQTKLMLQKTVNINYKKESLEEIYNYYLNSL